MIRSLFSLFVLCFVFVHISGGEVALADGKFFGRIDVADEPGILAQRGLVAFRDGVETLIVQSDVSGGDASFGWLLPLPAAPTSIEPCEPNTLTAISQVVRPRVVKFPTRFFWFSMVWTVLVILGCVRYVHRSHVDETHISIVGIILGIVVVLVMAAFSVQTMSKSLPTGVEVLQTAKAGVYDVTVIKAETGAAVGQWLSSNGFATSPSADAVITDYVADDWCFLAAKISADATADSNGTATHHPLKVTFPIDQAVYPMRLTGVSGEPVQLDLFVVAEKRASVPVMKTWVADTFARGRGTGRLRQYRQTTPTIYQGHKVSRDRFAIPAISDLMWPGCAMTRLHARLDPNEMREDLKLQWVLTRATRAKLYSRGSAAGWCGGVAAITLAVILICATSSATNQGWTWQMLLRRRLPLAIISGIAIGGGWFLTMETVPVDADRHKQLQSMFATMVHSYVLNELSEEPPGADFPEAYNGLMESDHNATLSNFDKPGDFKIEPSESGWNLTIIDRPFIQITIPISSNGVPQTR